MPECRDLSKSGQMWGGFGFLRSQARGKDEGVKVGFPKESREAIVPPGMSE